MNVFPLMKKACSALLLAVLFSFAQVAYAQSVSDARSYLKDHLTELGIGEKDIADLKIASSTSGGNGKFEILYVQQTRNEIEIHNRVINLIVQNGEIVSHSGTFAANIDRSTISSSPSISAEAGLRSAAKSLGLGNIKSTELLIAPKGKEKKGKFNDAGISMEDIPFRLVYQDNGKEGMSLSWEYVILEKSGEHWWQIRIDAQSGAYLDKNDWIANCNIDHSIEEASNGHIHGAECANPAASPLIPNAYNVFAIPVESPAHGTRSNELTPWIAGSGSPFGWHDTDGSSGAEYTITRGNNVYATEDQNADNNPGFAPDGGANLDFDFPINFANAPQTYVSAAVTNLFYWNNITHDVMYEYGFDEQSGNFQQNNYGNGGVGGDYVNADALDGSGTNNANFGTPPDGNNPRMQMYEFTLTTPSTTSDLDNGIIVHEYGHGISNRLTGGAFNVSCLFNDEQMGEGWSDYFALIMTMEPGDLATTNRGMGTYVLGQPNNGTGIRQYPYNFDLGVNPHTYNDVGGVAIPHGVGSIWCQMLWDMTWLLIDQYGYDPDIYNGTGGNNIALQLVIDGLKLQPCQPGFVDGRDAILLADQLNNGGANQCIIWEAFARRGLGVSADQGSSGSTTDGTAAFDTPCFCDPNPGALGCTDPTACNFDPAAACDDLSCIPSGCTNPAACNYDPDAGCDDGSCLLDGAQPELILTTDCWGNEVSWEILDAGNNVVASNPTSYGNQTTYTWTGCLPNDACYTFVIYDSYGDGLNGTAFGCSTDGSYQMYDRYGNLLFDIGPDPNYGFQATHPFCVTSDPGDISGCTNPAACNYNEFANIDDGSCVFPPSGDSCSDAIPVVVDGPTINASNQNTCFDGPDPFCGGTNIRDTWYSFVYTGGDITIETTTGTLVDTRLAVWDNCGGTVIACNDDIATGVYASIINLDCSQLLFGNTYYIQAGGWTNLTGAFTMDITSTPSAEGCTDNTACNYDPAAVCDDGSCTYPDGCTDPAACNYDPAATCDDGSCNNNAPSISTLSISASCFGGETVSIAGLNFCNVTDVSFGGLSAPNLVIFSLTQIEVTVPAPLSSGIVSVTVTTANGTSNSVPFEYGVLGCTNPAACNFNPAAVCDDGSCNTNAPVIVALDLGSSCFGGETLTITGANFCNVTDVSFGAVSGVSIISSSLTEIQVTVPAPVSSGTVSVTVTTANGTSNAEPFDYGIIGCTNPAACNYTPGATCNDGSCILPNGCTDPAACNFNPAATCDDGSCVLPNGCTNPVACNFDPAATCDDGSCILPDGCTDPAACNFDPAATCDDGSCILPNGCTNPVACNFDPAATCDDGSCILPNGCTDPAACNFDPAATCDDGSCILPDGCTDVAACNYNPAASCDDGSCTYGTTWYQDLDNDGFGNAAVSTTACSQPAGYVTDNTDCDDQNEFIYPGAPSTEEGIDNDCNGTVDPDEESPCFGDFNDDGERNVADLLTILGEMGCTGTGCLTDLNGDNTVNTGDMVLFLGIYGLACP